MTCFFLIRIRHQFFKIIPASICINATNSAFYVVGSCRARSEFAKKNSCMVNPLCGGVIPLTFSVADRYHEHFVHGRHPGTMHFNRFSPHYGYSFRISHADFVVNVKQMCVLLI